MRKLTPGAVIRAVRSRIQGRLELSRSERYYQNAEYRNVSEIMLPREYMDGNLFEQLHKRFSGTAVSFYFNDLESKLQMDAALRQGLLDISDKLLQGQIAVYDREVSLGDPPEWNMDITGCDLWPNLFFKNYRRYIRGNRERVGDFRFTWELNRQQHLTGLALAYRLTSDERYAHCIVNHIVSWIDKNPPFESVNWISSMEVGLRLVSWSLSLAQISATPVDPGVQKRIAKSIYQQIRFLCDNLSVDLSDAGGDTKLKNNHTIVELCSLLVTLELFPLDGSFLKPTDTVLEALRSELQRQTYSDGMHVEQASSYLRFVAESILLARLTIKGSDVLDLYIHHYVAALDAFRGLEEDIFLVGDEDNGHVLIPLYESRPESLAVVYGLYDALFAARVYDGDVARAHGKWNELATRTTCLEESGHWQARKRLGDSAVSLYFRAGRMDFPAIAGYAPHAHSDLLGFILALDGHLWLVDRGTYSYSDRVVSDELRLSPAHNTIAVEGFEQMRIIGSFNSDRHAQGKFREVDRHRVVGEAVLGNVNRQITVTREIALDNDNACIRFKDTVDGLRQEGVSWVLNFHPAIEVGDGGSVTHTLTGQSITIAGLEDFERKSVGYSPRYGVLQQATQLVHKQRPGDSSHLEKEWSILLSRS